MSENERIAKEVLEETRRRIVPDTDSDLVTKVYEIELKYQFSPDRTAARKLIRALVDDYIQANISEDRS